MVNLSSAFAVNPLIAILRGLKPENAGSVSGILIEAGFRVIEVPLNSPLPLESISKISSEYCENAVVGAGTVLTVDQVAAVADAGGKLIVSPNRCREGGNRTWTTLVPRSDDTNGSICCIRNWCISFEVFPCRNDPTLSYRSHASSSSKTCGPCCCRGHQL